MDDEELTGRTIAHFRLEERLGAGGMGVIYRAEERAAPPPGSPSR